MDKNRYQTIFSKEQNENDGEDIEKTQTALQKNTQIRTYGDTAIFSIDPDAPITEVRSCKPRFRVRVRRVRVRVRRVMVRVM